MKLMLVLAAVGLPTIALAPPPAVAQTAAAASAPARIDAIAWLTGSWVRKTSRGDIVEEWARVSRRTMEGMSYTMGRGARRVTEYLRLDQLGDDLFYIAKPSENPRPVAFTLTAIDSSRFQFENADHDFPQTITYTRLPGDSLLVVIEGRLNGESRTIPFRFVRKP